MTIADTKSSHERCVHDRNEQVAHCTHLAVRLSAPPCGADSPSSNLHFTVRRLARDEKLQRMPLRRRSVFPSGNNELTALSALIRMPRSVCRYSERPAPPFLPQQRAHAPPAPTGSGCPFIGIATNLPVRSRPRWGPALRRDDSYEVRTPILLPVCRYRNELAGESIASASFLQTVMPELHATMGAPPKATTTLVSLYPLSANLPMRLTWLGRDP